LSRLYPVYALTMLVSIPMLLTEWAVRSRVDFWEGAVATPLLLQGFFPHLATFWNTVSWTLSCEVVLYVAFPWLLKMRWPKGTAQLLGLVIGLWLVGMIPHTLYMVFNPDHFPKGADRYSDGTWINTLKYTPLPYLCTFLAGLTLGRLHEALKLDVRGRVVAGIAGFAGVWFVSYHFAERLPYVLVHGGLLTPLFAAIILGLAGPSPLASAFSWKPLVVIGASTYALYLLHFNVFQLLQNNHVWQRVGLGRFDPWVSYLFVVLLTQFDPWISYVFVILLAVAVRKWVEHPAQVAIGEWWKRRRATENARVAVS